MAKILIADDDDDMVEICSRLLSRQGHDLLVVRNAEAAVRTATSERPDLILMDMRMPTADDGKISDRAGLDATARLKADPPPPRSPSWPSPDTPCTSGRRRSSPPAARNSSTSPSSISRSCSAPSTATSDHGGAHERPR